MKILNDEAVNVWEREMDTALKRTRQLEARLTRLVEGLEEIRHEASECGSFMWIEEHADQLIKEARSE